MLLDNWQEEILNYDGDILLGKGRRIGATHIMAIKAVEHLVKNYNPHPKSQIVCVSITEEQAHLIIAFAQNYAKRKYPLLIARGMDKPTLTKLIMVVNGNKRILIAKPVGTTGDSVRGFEGQILMVDEAPKMPKLFWAAATPILATTGGKIWMWGTFFGTDNYFYKEYYRKIIAKDEDARFKVWIKDTEKVFKKRKISPDWTELTREKSLRFLEEEKKTMSRAEYAQEYLAIADSNLRQFFSDELIKSCMTLREGAANSELRGDNFLGVDIARLGGDETVLISLKMTSGNIFYQTDMEIYEQSLITETIRRIKIADQRKNYQRIYIDDGGMGVGVFDHLIEDEQTRRKVIGINNAKRSIEYSRDWKKPGAKKTLFKEDIYNNCLKMMEQKRLNLWSKDKIFHSLKSVQYEYLPEQRRIRIFGEYTHIAEALVRACWGEKEKNLNVWVSFQ